MDNVIDLGVRASTGKKYQDRLAETLQRLDSAADVLMEDLVNLAMVGPWCDWSEEQQVGAVSNINTQAMMESGDDKIVMLTSLLRHVQETVGELQWSTRR